jgi:hypothetical protein
VLVEVVRPGSEEREPLIKDMLEVMARHQPQVVIKLAAAVVARVK